MKKEILPGDVLSKELLLEGIPEPAIPEGSGGAENGLIQEGDHGYGEMKAEMGKRVIEKITRLAPDFESRILRHTTFTPKHMGTMFGAPGGDYCYGLIHPDQIGPNRPGSKGYVDQPIPIDGLYLASAGCHGGPGITFIPGYNAAKQALADMS